MKTKIKDVLIVPYDESLATEPLPEAVYKNTLVIFTNDAIKVLDKRTEENGHQYAMLEIAKKETLEEVVAQMSNLADFYEDFKFVIKYSNASNLVITIEG